MAAEMALLPSELDIITPHYFFELWKAYIKKKQREVMMLSISIRPHIGETSEVKLFEQLNHILNEAPDPNVLQQKKMKKYTQEELDEIQRIFELNTKKNGKH